VCRQMLTASVLAVSIRDASGVTMKPKNLIFCVWNKHFLGFGVQVVLAKVIQDTSDVNLVLFQRVREDEDVIEV